MARIAVGGFQHETNTFSDQPATLDDFVQGSGWPGLLQGQAMLTTVAPMNLPIAGAVATLTQLGHEVVPLVWAAATPSGRVEDQAFDTICAKLLAALDAAGDIDGMYLDLHGAMATAQHDDGEGELLRRLRAHVGNTLPIVASIDYHANISRDMVSLSDGLIGYRTYPHIDMDVTGSRAAAFLHQRLLRTHRHAVAWRQLDFLVPLTSQCTLSEPAAGIIDAVSRIEGEHSLASCTWAGGFALADIPDCGQTILAYGDAPEQVERAVTELDTILHSAESSFKQPIVDADDAVAYAIAQAATASGPIVLSDTQDNPGGGGSSDTVGLLKALVSQQARNAVVAIICDPDAARAAHEAGEHTAIQIALGGKADTGANTPGVPYVNTYIVEKLSSGRFTGTGPMWKGSPIDLGPSALLRVGGVRVIVASKKMQAADQSIFRHFDIDPAQCAILALKSSVHFRADFGSLAHEVVVVASPGLVYSRLSDIPYRSLRANVRLL